MLIADIYDPLLPNGSSAESNIYSAGLKELYDEIRRIIFDTKLVMSPLVTFKGKSATKGKPHQKGYTAAPKLPEMLNAALGIGLNSAGWKPLQTPGLNAPQSEIDWYKAKPSPIALGQQKLGLGLEIQFGNHLQFTQDIRHLANAQLDFVAEAGIIIVPSEKLASHKADRGASFPDAQRLLNNEMMAYIGMRAKILPALSIIAIEQDEYNNDQLGLFEVTPVKMDPKGKPTPTTPLTNANEPVMIRRKQTGKLVGPKE